VEFGLFVMPIHPPEKPWQQVMKEDTATITLADELGIHEAWIGEHHTLRTEPITAPDLFIANLFARTKKIKLGTGVILLQLHHPIMLAHRIAVLDHLGQGRFNFGIGTGGMPTEFELFGIPEPERHARAAEVMDVVMKIWQSDGNFEYKGQFFNITAPNPKPELGVYLHMKPYTQPHPPIAVAAGSPNSPTATYAGLKNWIVMSSGIMHPGVLGTIWDAYLKGAQKAGNGSPSRKMWRVSRNIHVAENMKQARKEANEYGMRQCITKYAMGQFMANRGNLDVFKPSKDIPDSQITFDWLLDNTFIVGDPDYVYQRIADLYQKMGGFGTLLFQLNGWDPPEVGQKSLSIFMKEVAPRLKNLSPS